MRVSADPLLQPINMTEPSTASLFSNPDYLSDNDIDEFDNN